MFPSSNNRSQQARHGWSVLLVALVFLSVPIRAEAADRYQEARGLAFSGQREAARVILTELLVDKPNHWDARILLGRLFAWDKRYDEAREQLLVVVRAKPNYADARSALADVELWSDHPEQALEFLEDGLTRKPTNEDFLYKKAVAQKKLGDLRGAALTLDQLNDVNPSHARGNKLFASLRLERTRNKMSFGYGYTNIDTVSNPWHAGSFELSRRTGIGTVALRVNYANRFQRGATQYEIDAYPRIMHGLYVYMNYGYSSDTGLYPKHRYAGELYANLPGGVEISAGARRLVFGSSSVTIYTGTLAKYEGNWWISFRPYITPKIVGTSRSYQLTVRRYFGDADNYFGLSGGRGSSPGELRDLSDLIRLNSWKVGFRLQKTLGDALILKLSGRYGQEELISNHDRRRFSLGIGFERRF